MKQDTSTATASPLAVPPGPLPGDEAPDEDGRALRWEGHRQRRRAGLIRAARRAIHRHGPSVPMEDIAGAAKTSKSVLYRYFGGKEGLRAAIAADVVEQLRTAILDATHASADPGEALRAMIHTYLSQAAASPHTYAFVVGSAEADPGAGEQVQLFTAQLRELMTERLAQMSRTDPRLADPSVALVWPDAAIGMIRFAGERWLAVGDGETSLDTMTDHLTTWLLSGIAPPPPGAPATTVLGKEAP